MQQHKLKQRILSSLLILAMILTMIPSALAFAGTPDANGHPPSNGTGDATSAGNQYNGREDTHMKRNKIKKSGEI